jgi:hypothetical protein
MTALFPRWANTVVRATLVAGACGVVGVPVALMAWVRTPNATRRYQPVAQPIAFDHRIHVTGQRIDCRYCHFSVERAATAGIPASSACVACHSDTWMRSKDLALVRVSVATGQPIRWNRVNALPDFVYFNHAIHVDKGIGCESCHGRVDRMGVVYQAAPLTMSWCLECHRDPASQLRPVSEITTMGWTPPAPQRQLGDALVRENNVRSLTTCTTCHR